MNREPYIPEAWEEVDCMFCDSADKKLYHRYGNDLQFTYVLCNNCSLVYQSPRPRYDKAFIEAAYGRYFMFDPGYQYQTKAKKIFNEELIEISKYDTRQESILDVGSAMGDFLNVAQEYYPLVEGVDVSEQMASFVKKNMDADVHLDKYENLSINKKYTCIHMSHVIEHIPNPVDWLEKSKELLADEGVLVIAVPNMFSLSRLFKLFLKRVGLRKGKWKDSWRTPDHLFEPTVKSMKKFVTENGYQILDYYSYSRKNMTARGGVAFLFNRWMYLGSNLRFYLRVDNK